MTGRRRVLRGSTLVGHRRLPTHCRREPAATGRNARPSVRLGHGAPPATLLLCRTRHADRVTPYTGRAEGPERGRHLPRGHRARSPVSISCGSRPEPAPSPVARGRSARLRWSPVARAIPGGRCGAGRPPTARRASRGARRSMTERTISRPTWLVRGRVSGRTPWRHRTSGPNGREERSRRRYLPSGLLRCAPAIGTRDPGPGRGPGSGRAGCRCRHGVGQPERAATPRRAGVPPGTAGAGIRTTGGTGSVGLPARRRRPSAPWIVVRATPLPGPLRAGGPDRAHEPGRSIRDDQRDPDGPRAGSERRNSRAGAILARHDLRAEDLALTVGGGSRPRPGRNASIWSWRFPAIRERPGPPIHAWTSSTSFDVAIASPRDRSTRGVTRRPSHIPTPRRSPATAP